MRATTFVFNLHSQLSLKPNTEE